MARTLSDVASGRRSIDQPNCAAIAIMPVFIVLPAVLAASDLIAIAKLAPGVKLVDFDIIAPQLDSNGAPTLAHSIGAENAGATDLGVVYEAGLTFGRTANGSISRASTAVQMLADASAERMISLKTTTGAATAALAGKTILVNLHLQA
jgi:hypothetical protein